MERDADWGEVLAGVRRPPPSAADGAALLDLAVSLGADVAGDVTGCSLTVGTPRGWSTPHAWQSVAVSLDRAQYDAGTGPCIEAAATARAQDLPVIAADGRFPGFAAAAGDHGVLSSLSLPLPNTPQPSALNLYATSRGAFATQRHHRVAALLARAVAVLLGAPPSGAAVGARGELAVGRGARVRRAVRLHAAQTGLPVGEAYLRLAMRTRREGRGIDELAAEILGDDDVSPAVLA